MAANRFALTVNQAGMNYNYNVVVDFETGVNYFFCKGTMGAGLCPVYKPDGTIIVTPKEELFKIKGYENYIKEREAKYREEVNALARGAAATTDEEPKESTEES